MAFKSLAPILNTSDLPALVEFLKSAGFSFLWDVRDDGTSEVVYAGMAYEEGQFHIQPADSTPKGMQAYFEVDNVDQVHAGFKSRGVNATDPKDQFYGMRDFEMKGPEGTSIGFGSQISA